LISGIYRTADFPFVLSYTTDRRRSHERRYMYIVIIPVYVYAYDWPRSRIINFLRIINQLAGARLAPRVRKQPRKSRGRLRGFFDRPVVTFRDWARNRERANTSETNFHAVIYVYILVCVCVCVCVSCVTTN